MQTILQTVADEILTFSALVIKLQHVHVAFD